MEKSLKNETKNESKMTPKPSPRRPKNPTSSRHNPDREPETLQDEKKYPK